ncbi:probable glycerol-3-phosphate acyltransferase 3 [Phragmites australis]|uniref:probable glycerol-3-phosphate acyltransferase 3 n=1 Tax=Phragmites australis TaxID=29695 RepID=UPI002D77C308|nr:probable glycerol-3-phosphate acyltransferase 3 [Phragmites australis]
MAKKKLLAHKLFSTMVSLLLHGRRPLSRAATATGNAAPPPPHPCQLVHHNASPPTEKLADQQTTLVVDVDTALLRSGDLLPYFMLVALEAGGFLRGLLLLLLYPLVCCVSRGVAMKLMAAVAFCGLRASRFRAGRAVLPKWFMEDVAAEGFEAVRAAGRRVCVTGMPRVMVEGFLREYLEAEAVVGREMKVLWGFYTGLMQEEEEEDEQQVVMATEEEKNIVVAFSGSMEFLKHPLSRSCKDIYVVSSEEKSKWRPLPRDKYPKPMVFHDGRLAFRPTAAYTAAMFAWLPFGAALGAARLAVALTVPYKYSTPILAATGMSWRLKGERPPLPSGGRGQLFVCNHRTLIDPVYVSVALDRQVRAVSYSLSRLSELISPIGRTVRLTRDRDSDGQVMARLLDRGDLVVVCPEGTTCREPYLLRFSPLFAELSDDVVPVGIAVETSMFYATTAGGLKCFDPLYYMVNPRMCYTVQFLDKVDTSPVRDRAAPSTDMANLVQRKMGDALGYGCTMLTRKDKYLMLAGNDGIVRTDDKSQSASAAATAAGKKKKKSTEKNN